MVGNNNNNKGTNSFKNLSLYFVVLSLQGTRVRVQGMEGFFSRGEGGAGWLRFGFTLDNDGVGEVLHEDVVIPYVLGWPFV